MARRGFLNDVGRGLDRLVSVVAPVAGAKRAMARGATARARQLSAYDGAKSSRAWHGRPLNGGSPDADLDETALHRLRERSRDRYRNDGIARASLNSLTDNVVGVGFRPQLRLPWKRLGITEKRARDLAEQAELLWSSWGKHADSTNRLHIQDLQAQWFAQVLLNGDVFVRPIMVRDARIPTPFGLELKFETLEADRVDTPQGLGTDRARVIRSGVELGKRGQPVAYWIADNHPGDELLTNGRPLAAGSRTFRRIPAHSAAGRPNVLHLYHQERPGQSRGAPLLSPVLDLFKNLDDYVEAEVVAAQVSACFAVFITNNDPWGSMNAAAAQTTSTGSTSHREEELSPGIIERLGPGESIETANPGRPNTVFEAFVRAAASRITSALGLPYEIALRDFSGTTYSQARASMLEARRMFVRRQRWLTAHAMQPAWAMLLEEAWLRGAIDFPDDFAERIELWTRTHWITPGFGMVDPDKEAKARETLLRLGLTTKSKEIASIDGDTHEDTAEQRAAEMRREQALGLTTSPPAMPAEDQGDDDGEEPEDDADEERDDDAQDTSDDTEPAEEPAEAAS